MLSCIKLRNGHILMTRPHSNNPFPKVSRVWLPTYCIIVIIQIGVVCVELHELNFDDPVLLLLCHEPCVLILHLLPSARVLVLLMRLVLLPRRGTLVVVAVSAVFVAGYASSETQKLKHESASIYLTTVATLYFTWLQLLHSSKTRPLQKKCPGSTGIQT